MNFKCGTPACGKADIADRMFNINILEAGKPLRRVVICGRCAREARKAGHTTFRYSETLRRDAARIVARQGRTQFFSDLLKVATGKSATAPSVPPAPISAPQAT